MIQFSEQKTIKKDDDDIPLVEYLKKIVRKTNTKYDKRGKDAHKQDRSTFSDSTVSECLSVKVKIHYMCLRMA